MEKAKKKKIIKRMLIITASVVALLLLLAFAFYRIYIYNPVVKMYGGKLRYVDVEIDGFMVIVETLVVFPEDIDHEEMQAATEAYAYYGYLPDNFMEINIAEEAAKERKAWEEANKSD